MSAEKSNTARHDYRESHKHPDKGWQYDIGIHHGRYRSIVFEWEKSVLRQILNDYDDDHKVALLDFACGTGRIIGFLEDHVARATGVDVSESMLAVARHKLKKSEIVLGDVTKEGILNGRCFNLVTAFRFFLNAQPSLRIEALTVLEKHLSEDGLLVFNNHMQQSSIMHLVLRFWSFLRYRKDNELSLSMRQIRSMVDKTGFRIVKVFHWGLLPATDNHMPLPPWLLVKLENWFSRRRFLQPLAQNAIIVCAKARKEDNAGL